jgi:hypothetical protein
MKHSFIFYSKLYKTRGSSFLRVCLSLRFEFEGEMCGRLTDDSLTIASTCMRNISMTGFQSRKHSRIYCVPRIRDSQLLSNHQMPAYPAINILFFTFNQGRFRFIGSHQCLPGTTAYKDGLTCDSTCYQSRQRAIMLISVKEDAFFTISKQ